MRIIVRPSDGVILTRLTSKIIREELYSIPFFRQTIAHVTYKSAKVDYIREKSSRRDAKFELFFLNERDFNIEELENISPMRKKGVQTFILCLNI